MTKDSWEAALVLAVLDYENGDPALLHAMALVLAELDEARTILLQKGYGEGYSFINFAQLADRLPERRR